MQGARAGARPPSQGPAGPGSGLEATSWPRGGRSAACKGTGGQGADPGLCGTETLGGSQGCSATAPSWDKGGSAYRHNGTGVTRAGSQETSRAPGGRGDEGEVEAMGGEGGFLSVWERPNGGHRDEQPHRTRRGLPALPRPRLGRGPSSSQVEARGWHCSGSRAAARPRRRPPGCSPAPTVRCFSLGFSLPACKRGTPAHPAPECAPLCAWSWGRGTGLTPQLPAVAKLGCCGRFHPG